MIPKDKYGEKAACVSTWINDYFERLESLPVKSKLGPGEIYGKIPEEAPENGEDFDKIMEDMDRIIVPGITHWQHPNFHAYFPANTSVESILAEQITAAVGAQCMIWDTSPAAAELEERMSEWIRKAMDLPEHFEGVVQDSASTATLVALITAREVATEFTSNLEGVPRNLRVYCSSEAHSSVEKAMGICGMGRNNLIKIQVGDNMAMIPEKLEEAIKNDLRRGMTPCAVVSAMGTTGTVAIDPLEQLAEICSRYKIWLHVDAAYAGSALFLEEYRWMKKGIEQADSFVFNPHKWLFTNFDCSLYYVRNTESLIRSFEILPEYLKTRTRGIVKDYRDWGVPLGRRFRALKLWFVLRSFGLTGIRERLRSHVELSDYFCRELLKIPGMEMLSKPVLNFSCFRYNPEGLESGEKPDKLNAVLLDRINGDGRVFLTHTKVKGAFGIRMLIGQTYVEKRHVDLALTVIREAIHHSEI